MPPARGQAGPGVCHLEAQDDKTQQVASMHLGRTFLSLRMSPPSG